MRGTGHRIKNVMNGSPAEKAGLRPGHSIIEINKRKIEDIFDYQYEAEEEILNLYYIDEKDQVHQVTIEKEQGEDPGLEFENGLMDDYRSCHNKCIFCFIDQMPSGMRETLYFKDDDSRLSFLQGNYVTLTNMSEHDIDRIIEFNLSPINISFQTTNPELRCKMLNNRFAGEALGKARKLFENNIKMNGQIVLCKGVNDGEELERSIRDLSEFAPVLESVSVVPVGLSKYRDGLYPLLPFEKEEAVKVLQTIHRYQKELFDKCGLHFIHASDEWYLLAEKELPAEETYDGYLQLENGVGMLRLLINEFSEALLRARKTGLKFRNPHLFKKRTITMATGMLAYSTIKGFAQEIMEYVPTLKIQVIPIKNNFFGEHITVSGLLTGKDIIEQLSDIKIGERLLLPENVLRSGEEVFLDDVTLSEMEKTLQVKVDIVKSSGCDLLNTVLGLKSKKA